jgi:ferredoxin--NADP+ reductase
MEELEQSSKVRKNIAELNQLKANETTGNEKTIHLLFYSSPIEIIEENGQIKKVKFQKNKLEGSAGVQKARPTGETFDIDCTLLLRSIGYRGVPFKGLPFDDRTGTIPNKKGQVIKMDGSIIENVFVTGWIKRGPSGVIGTNRSDSIETIATCLTQIENASIEDPKDIELILTERNIQYLSYADWKIIDQYEISEGEKSGKPREKLTSIDQIFSILKK